MKQKIALFVIATHALFILICVMTHKQKPPLPHQSIAVNTYTLLQKHPKKIEPAAPRPKKARDVMKEMQKTIAKIPPKQDNPKSSPKVQTRAKPQYPLLLVQTLKRALHLPEEGDVRLMLSIKASGEVIDVQILQSKSEENARYLKAEIPSLRFPAFTAELGMQKQHNFTLTFRHDD